MFEFSMKSRLLFFGFFSFSSLDMADPSTTAAQALNSLNSGLHDRIVTSTDNSALRNVVMSVPNAASAAFEAKQSTHWCFTLNNPVLTGEEYLAELEKHPKFRFAVCQLEKGDNGTPHLQGYIEFTRQLGFLQMKALEPRAHWEPRQGTRAQARKYCRKMASRIAGPWELGTWKTAAGTRTDLAKACKLVKEEGITALVEQQPHMFVKYSRGFEKLSFMNRGRREKPPRVILHYGPTGTFKTGLVLYRHPDAYKKPAGTKWFDGYKDQKVLLLDDFAGASSGFRLDYTLQLLDRYDIDVELKGAHVRLLAETIYVTTNIHPNDWFNYENRQGQYAALARRFTEVWHFTSFDLPPRKITSSSFFEDWFSGCDEEIVFISDEIKKEKMGLPRWITAETDVVEISSDSEDSLLWFDPEEETPKPPKKRRKLVRTEAGYLFAEDEVFVPESQATMEYSTEPTAPTDSYGRKDVPDIDSDDSMFDEL